MGGLGTVAKMPSQPSWLYRGWALEGPSGNKNGLEVSDSGLSGAHFLQVIIPESVRGAGWTKDLSWLFC